MHSIEIDQEINNRSRNSDGDITLRDLRKNQGQI